MIIKGTTKLTGVFGYPVKHSLSPVFQNAGYQYLKLDYIYIPLEVEPKNLEKAVESLRIFNFIGVNVTIPHKKNIVSFLDELDEEAKLLGVVNTIHNKNGKLKGYSTDGKGFIRSLKEDGKFLPENKTVLILGAGGSSYAITGALIKEKIKKIFICNRTEEKSILLKKHLKENFRFENVEVVKFSERNEKFLWKDIDLVVNTTSVGMKEGDICLIEKENLHYGIFVYDIIYNRETELLKMAKELKISCLDGLSMLIYQGSISFEIWTGEKAPIEIMKKSIK